MAADSHSISAYAEIWRKATARLEFEIPPAARAYFEANGELDDYVKAGGDTSQEEEVLDGLVGRVRRMVEAGLIEPAPAPLRSPVDTERWRLVNDLLAQHNESIGDVGGSHWAPVEAAADSMFRIEYLEAFGGRRVALRFDGRMSLRALTSAIRMLWPELGRRGLVRRVKGPEVRGLALIRFVCLHTPLEQPWRDRWGAWERQHGDRWHYANHRAFNTDFHRAERQLTGRPRGLAPFYNRRAWVEARPTRGLLALARDGDSDALAAVADSASTFHEVGLAIAAHLQGITAPTSNHEASEAPETDGGPA